MNEKVTVEYQIIGIGNHPNKKVVGWVAVFLEPTQPLGINDTQTPNQAVISSHSGSRGGQIPPEIQQMVFGMIEQSRHEDDEHDERSIAFLEPKIDFVQRGWKFGDVVNVTFEKTKNAEDVSTIETENLEEK